jgi:tetratricopeptide (TPR) repeat protein
VRLCQLHLRAQDFDAALEDYNEYENSGGETIPESTWLELRRAAEAKEQFDRAVADYERLASAYPAERQSLLALMAAGRLALKRLNRPSDALRYYKAAEASAVPHLDWQTNIEAGIREAEKALGASYTSKQ